MKVAVIGKGGSGKSSVSWLLTHTLLADNRTVFAIDADHNMDFTALLGGRVDADTVTMHRTHGAFKDAVGQQEGKYWQDIVLDGRPLPTFTLTDAYTAQIAHPLGEHLYLATVGLGAEDVLFSDKCAHGHSAVLKYYLPLFDGGDTVDVVVDGVAGTDMMNFGLFTGADAVVVVVEPHQNSMRVLEQVAVIAVRSALPLYVVMNKVRGESAERTALIAQWGEVLLAELPVDTGMLTYAYDALAPETRTAAQELVRTLRARTAHATPGIERLRAFEQQRT